MKSTCQMRNTYVLTKRQELQNIIERELCNHFVFGQLLLRYLFTKKILNMELNMMF